MREENNNATLSCTLRDCGDGRCECTVTCDGSANGLANAYETITTHLLNTYVEEFGVDMATGVFAMILEKALEKSGAGEALMGRMQNG